jgi:hypothetical protein
MLEKGIVMGAVAVFDLMLTVRTKVGVICHCAGSFQARKQGDLPSDNVTGISYTTKERRSSTITIRSTSSSSHQFLSLECSSENFVVVTSIAFQLFVLFINLYRPQRVKRNGSAAQYARR